MLDDERRENDRMLSVAADTIATLEDRLVFWQGQYNDMRHLLYSSNTKFQDNHDGSWFVNSFGDKILYSNLEEAIEGSEKDFNERYPFPK